MDETELSQDTIGAASKPDPTADEDLINAVPEPSKFDLGLSRRGLLISGGLLGLLGLGSGGASADASGQIGTSSDPLIQLHTEALNGASLPDFTQATDGEILAFDANNDLTLAANGGDVSELTTSNFVGLQVVDGGTSVSSESDGNNSANIIGGHPSNSIAGNGSVVFGGQSSNKGNGVDGDYSGVLSGYNNTNDANSSVIAGGVGNQILNSASMPSFIGGGQNNVASGQGTTIGGGDGNKAEGTNSSIGGGTSNTASGNRSIVCGGKDNEASGDHAAIVGGESNEASGNYSCAGGYNATADQMGSFVWGDSTGTAVSPDGANEVRFQASGGFVIQDTDTLKISKGLATGTGTTVKVDTNGQFVEDNSSARYKTDIEPIHTASSGVLDLQPVSYRFNQTGGRDIGLIAEDVERSIPELVIYDTDGRPEAVKYDRIGIFLTPEVSENRDRIGVLEATHTECASTIEELETALDAEAARVADQADRIEQLEAVNAQLTSRLNRLEGRLDAHGATADLSVADD